MDVAVIGAGQAGLATGYHLQRAGLEPGADFVLVDAGSDPGGAWPRMWQGLHLFSPSGYSSLPGWMMPPWRASDSNGEGASRPVSTSWTT